MIDNEGPSIEKDMDSYISEKPMKECKNYYFESGILYAINENDEKIRMSKKYSDLEELIINSSFSEEIDNI